jgi:hypothetical protein
MRPFRVSVDSDLARYTLYAIESVSFASSDFFKLRVYMRSYVRLSIARMRYVFLAGENSQYLNEISNFAQLPF